MKHNEKVKDLVKEESQFSIAYKIGVSIPTLTKRMRDNEFTLSQAAKIDEMWKDINKAEKEV